MSPEIILNKPTSSACDVWSYGVILKELLTGEKPYSTLENKCQIIFKVAGNEPLDFILLIADECPRILKTLMQRCLKREASE